jgi:HAD superfamily hydrolase (TIGR01509 family)
MPDAVIFDLDGVLLDSEQRWNEAKEALVRESGGTWLAEAPEVMMGMSSPEWSAYLHDDLAVPLPREEINREVVRRMEDAYRDGLPLLPGAGEAVRALAARWPLGLASSSNRELIDLFAELAGFGDSFRVTVSSEEVARGKPSPDVYLRAAEKLGVEAARCVAIEDSSNGIRAGVAAGMPVIAVPNPHYPPAPDALALAAATVGGVAEITPELVERVEAGSDGGG